MRLYLDDNTAKQSQISRLRQAGHTVVQPADVALSGAWDPRHLLHAIQHDLRLLTRNYDDFLDLHQLVQSAGGRHAGPAGPGRPVNRSPR